MTTKQFLPLPYGKDVYSELKGNGCYFVDKTPYLKELIDKDKSNVMLFTRPRRFGKTLFMSMVEYFLKINSANPGDTTLQQKLFKDTKILDDQEFCAKYMGQHPVICLTLKGVYGKTFTSAYYKTVLLSMMMTRRLMLSYQVKIFYIELMKMLNHMQLHPS